MPDDLEHLFDEKKFDEVRKRANVILSQGGSEAQANYWLARLERKEGKIVDALQHIEAAFALDPLDDKIAGVYMDVLFGCGEIRKALIFYDDLAKPVAESDRIKHELYWIYYLADWNAKARKVWAEIAPDSQHNPYGGLRFQILFTVLQQTIDRITLKLEEREAKTVRSYDSSVAVIDAQTFQTKTQAIQAQSESDSALIAGVRLQFRWTAFARFLTRFLLLCDLIATLVVSVNFRGPLPIVLAAPCILAVTGIIVGASAWAFGRSSRYLPATAAASAAAIVPGIAGAAMLRTTHDNWLHWVAISIIFGTAAAAIFGIMNFTMLTAWFWKKRRYDETHAFGWIISTLAEIAATLPEIEDRSSSVRRRGWVRDLEAGAKLTETRLAAQVAFNDDTTKTWLSDWFAGVAESMRHTKRHLASPSDQGWKNFSRTIHQHLHSFATENWRSAPYRKPPEPEKISLRDRGTAIVKFLIGAIVPGLGYLAVAPLIGVTEDAFKRAVLLSGAWALLSLLLILDPAVKDKTAVAKDMLGTWSPLMTRKTGAADEKPPSGSST